MWLNYYKRIVFKEMQYAYSGLQCLSWREYIWSDIMSPTGGAYHWVGLSI